MAPSPLPLEDLIPEARQLTRRRRLRVSASALATVSLVAFAGFAGGAWNAAHPSTSPSNSSRALALAPACTAASHLSLTSFHQGSAMSNVFRVVFTNHGRPACSLRGVPTLRFVNGPRHVPEGPSNARVYSDQRVTSLDVPSTASVVATIWSDEPVALASRQCGTWRPETGIISPTARPPSSCRRSRRHRPQHGPLLVRVRASRLSSNTWWAANFSDVHHRRRGAVSTSSREPR